MIVLTNAAAEGAGGVVRDRCVRSREIIICPHNARLGGEEEPTCVLGWDLLPWLVNKP